MSKMGQSALAGKVKEEGAHTLQWDPRFRSRQVCTEHHLRQRMWSCMLVRTQVICVPYYRIFQYYHQFNLTKYSTRDRDEYILIPFHPTDESKQKSNC